MQEDPNPHRVQKIVLPETGARGNDVTLGSFVLEKVHGGLELVHGR